MGSNAKQPQPNTRLRYERKLRHWTQEDVANELSQLCDEEGDVPARGEITAKMVGIWERGEYTPSPFWQKKLGKLFGKNAEELGFIERQEKIQEVSHPFTTPAIHIMIPGSVMSTNPVDAKLSANGEASIPVGEQGQSSASSPPVAAQDAISLRLLQALESSGIDIDRIRQKLLAGVLALAESAFILSSDGLRQIEQGSNTLSDGLIAFFEDDIATRWELYYTGGTARAAQGLDRCVREIEKVSRLAQGTSWHNRVLLLLTMSYQLQSCVMRDMMLYKQAHVAYQRAFEVAQELDEHELMSSALAREGVTLIQQEKTKEAIIYLAGALNIIEGQSYPRLQGYIFKALSEAYAQDQQTDESRRNIDQAERALALQEHNQERSLIRLSAATLAAQKGVNAVLLHDHQGALTLIDESLRTYDPTIVRGRARLMAQKAEAYYGLGIVDACTKTAEDALVLASAVGANKTTATVKKLHAALTQSLWRKEEGITRLGKVLSL